MNPVVLKRHTHDDLYDFVSAQCLERLRAELRSKGDRRRLRVTDLPTPVMERLAERLNAEGAETHWAARMLVAGEAAAPWQATATKLVELRDHFEKPLLVFLPVGLRTAAEDSLDVATFTEVPLAPETRAFAEELLKRLPAGLRGPVEEVLKQLRRERRVRSADQEVEYLLTVDKNHSTPQAAGGAIFLFGLLPDFELFAAGQHRQRLAHNSTMSDALAEVRRPLQERIARLRVAPDTVQRPLFRFLCDRHVDEPVSWTSLIACEVEHRSLAFEHWQLLDAPTKQDLRLILDPLDLEMQEPDEIGGATPMLFWNPKQNKPIKLTYASTPLPVHVEAWKSVRIQLLELNDGQATLVWSSNNTPKPKAKAKTKKFTRQIKASDLENVADGSYFFRIDALAADGTALTENQPAAEGGRADNESPLFLVLRGEGSGQDVPQRSVKTTSFSDAWCSVASKPSDPKGHGPPRPQREELTGKWDQSVGAAVQGDVHFTFDNSGANGLSIRLPGLLREVENKSLENPEQFGWYRLDLTQARVLSDITIEPRWKDGTPDDTLTQAFLAARRSAFGAILDQHVARAKVQTPDPRRRGTVETVDLLPLQGVVEAYARAFLAWANAALAEGGDPAVRRLIGGIDVVELRWRANGGDPGRALLLGPLHPLRLVWHLQHSALVDRTLNAWQTRAEEARSWPRLVEQLQRGLTPANLPMVLFDDTHRGYVEREQLTTHWSLYLPDRGAGGQRVDVAASRASVRRHLGIRGRYVSPQGLSAEGIAARVVEYLEQHPYVGQLRINVFNPGDGQLVADTLRAVEGIRLQWGNEHEEPPLLRYAVQLFAPPEHVDETGEALDALLDPERQVSENDEFSLGSGDHLRPKLLITRATLDEFVRSSSSFTAHITLFAEHFLAEARLGDVRPLRRGTFVGGLVAEPETRLIERPEGAAYGWMKGVRPAASSEVDGLERLLVETHALVQAIEASDAAGAVAPVGTVPILSLRLEPTDQALIRLVHDTSDWVLTMDRNLGVDYFDSAGSVKECGYLLDFSPEFLQEDQARVMLTTRSTTELERMLRPALVRVGLNLPAGGEVMVLETLRSLSGRLALRMQSGPAMAAEVAGLLVARWALERVGLLQDRIVIPIDAHRGWFSTDEADPLAPAQQRRADLLLVRLHPNARRVEVTVIEVKQRDEVQARDRGRLYAQMHEQADATIRRLREIFDPDLFTTPRADRFLRAKELTNVLGFYLARAQRYGLVNEVTATEAAAFIETLDNGYQLSLKKLGLLHESNARGYHVDEDEPGFPIHRIGGDVAARLLLDAYDAHMQAAASNALQGGSEPLRPRDPSPSLLRELDTLRAQLAPGEPRWSAPPAVAAPPAVRGNTSPPTVTLPPAAVAQHGAKEDAPKSDAEVFVRLLPMEIEAPSAVDPSPTELPVATEAYLPATHTAPSTTMLGEVITLGASERTQQFGIIGRAGSSKVALDLNGCNTISLFGVQGFGKSYTMGVIAEMAVQPMSGINTLPSPLATVIFHYHKSDGYEPEFATALHPNGKVTEVERLAREYGAHPEGLRDMVLLVPQAKLEQRREEYPGIEVRPIRFASSELGADGWKFLMGAVGNDSLYVKQIVAIMQRARGKLTLAKLKSEIEEADLPKSLRKLAEARVALAEDYIDDGVRLGEVLRPGRTVIVDLRDEWLERDDALGLFVVMMTIFGAVRYHGKLFSKLMVFDEAHKYITESELIGQVVGIIREMRHQATSVLIASQDPLSVPRAVIELTSLLLLHRMTSPQWLKHLKSAIGALDSVTEAQVGSLMQGEALVWTQRSSEARYTQRPQKVLIRPRITQHGGGTKTAVAGATMR
jgi:DNA phosphorothioation-dependent restriction protein DptH